MKILVALAASLLSIAALAAPPTAASIERLLAVTETQKMVSAMEQQIAPAMKVAMEKSLEAQKLPPKAKALATV